MKMQRYTIILFLVAANWFCSSKAQDCTLPSQSVVNQALEDEVFSGGGEGGTFNIRGGPYYTCQVQGTTMGTYQELSIIMEYTDNGGDKVSQFEMICVSSGGVTTFSRRTPSTLTLLSVGSGVTYDSNIGLRTDCSSCTNQDNPNNNNNCQACNSACNADGLMRCTGGGAGDCCLAFDPDGTCQETTNCTTPNFIANAQNNFICTCGLSSCSDGYALNSTSCTCYLTDICLADNPCDNNGNCSLVTTPDQYTCNCTDNYTGTNCTEFIPPPVVVVTSSVVPSGVGNGGGVVSSTVVMGGSMSSSAPVATPTPSPDSNTCVDNCKTCLNASCCMECTSNYTIIGDSCTCLLLSHAPCKPGCSMCSLRPPHCCEQCEDGFTISREDRCQCITIAVSPSSATQLLRPTSTGTTDSRANTDELKSTDIAVIIPSIILGILVLIVLIVMIIYIIYYFLLGSATAAAKAKLASPFLPGEAHDNPMYVDPESFD